MKKLSIALVSLLLAFMMLVPSAFAADKPIELPLCEPGTETLTLMIPENFYTGNSYADNLPVFQELEKKTGVKIVCQPYGHDTAATEAAKTRLSAGSDLPDITFIPGNDVTRYASSGIIIPLEDLIKEYAPNIYEEFFVKLPVIGGGMTSPDGHVYTIANAFYGGNLVDMPGILIRKDWLDKLGLEMPTTLDDWYTVLKAFKEGDPNGNGIADEIPFASTAKKPLNEYGYLATAFGLTCDYYNDFQWAVDEDWNLTNQYTLPEFKEYLEFLSKLYSEGLIMQTWGSDNTEGIDSVVAQNTVGVCVNWHARAKTYEGTLELGGFPGADIQHVLPPVDDNGDIRISERQAIGNYIAITKDCKNPELAIKWLDYVCGSDEGMTFTSYGIEGVSYTVEDGKKVFTEYISNNPEGLNQFYALRSIGACTNLLMNRTTEFYLDVIEPRYVEMAKQLWPYMCNKFPSLIATEDENDEIAMIESTLIVYEDEMIYKFVTGKESLDKFDEFVSTCKDLGLDRLLEIKQGQINRVMGK